MSLVKDNKPGRETLKNLTGVINWSTPEIMENIEKLKEWYRLSRYREFMQSHEEEAAWDKIQQRIHHRYRVSLWRKWGGIAAMFVIVAGVGVWFLNNAQQRSDDMIIKRGEPVMQNPSSVLKRTSHNYAEVRMEDDKCTISVPMGAEYTEKLPDGTSVVMNAGTVLHYKGGVDSNEGDKREVELMGEAYFAVAHNVQQPFVVTTPVGEIEVLGTRFNVQADKEMTTVTLEEGSVRLHFSDRDFTMKPGEQARMHSDGMFEMRQVNAANYTSWSTGTYEFSDATLEEIVRQLSLWYDVNITIADKALRNTRYTGVILRNETLETSISVLTTISDLDFQVKGKDIVVTSR